MSPIWGESNGYADFSVYTAHADNIAESAQQSVSLNNRHAIAGYHPDTNRPSLRRRRCFIISMNILIPPITPKLAMITSQ